MRACCMGISIPPIAKTSKPVASRVSTPARCVFLTGVPHFRQCHSGWISIADLTFLDDTFPGRVAMTAFNPFIPQNDRDSGIPAASSRSPWRTLPLFPLRIPLQGR